MKTMSYKLKRAKNLIWNNTPFKKLTSIANFMVTAKCTYLCQTCNIGQKYLSNHKAASDLTTDEIIHFIKQNKSILQNVDWIQLTGGEPFMRDDMDKIINGFLSHIANLRIWITTNAFKPDKVIDTLSKIDKTFCRNIGIGISLHGYKKAHDHFCGKKNSFSKAMKLVALLKEKQKHGYAFNIGIGFTLTNENADDLLRVQRIAKDEGLSFSFRVPNLSNNYYSNDNFNLSSDTILNKVNEFLKYTENDSRNVMDRINRTYYLGIPSFIQRPKKRILPCNAGRTSLFIANDGSVFPCLFVDTKLGNIKYNTLESILGDHKNVALSKKIRKGHCPNCWVECETYRNIYENLFNTTLLNLKP